MIPLDDTPGEDANVVNTNMFRNLESSVSEDGENFSTGWVLLLSFLVGMYFSDMYVYPRKAAVLYDARYLNISFSQPFEMRPPHLGTFLPRECTNANCTILPLLIVRSFFAIHICSM